MAPIEISSSSSKISISITPLTTVTETGGLSILRYEIQVDSGNGLGYQTIQNSTEITASYYQVTKSRIYGFRYRAINLIGAGPYSAITYIQAVDVPS